MVKKLLVAEFALGVAAVLSSSQVLASQAAGEANGVAEKASLENRVSALEEKAKEKTPFNIGPGAEAVYQYKDYNDRNKSKGGDFDIAKFILHINGDFDNGLYYNTRWDWQLATGKDFPAWMYVGYRLSPHWDFQAGLTEQPFGAGYKGGVYFNSFMGDLPLYLGFDNNADMGFKGLYSNGPLDVVLGAYKNPERQGQSGHYRPDVTALGTITAPGTGTSFEANDEPINQVGGSVAYTLNKGSTYKTTVGVTARVGQLYNTATDETGSHWGGAVFVSQQWSNWNFTLQALDYDYSPERPAGQNNDSIALSNGRLMPQVGTVYSSRITYDIPIAFGPYRSVTVFDDFDYLNSRSNDQFTGVNTTYNVAGFRFTSGHLFTWLTVQSGKNANVAFVGPDNNDGDWYHNFNFITGLYF